MLKLLISAFKERNYFWRSTKLGNHRLSNMIFMQEKKNSKKMKMSKLKCQKWVSKLDPHTRTRELTSPRFEEAERLSLAS